MTDVRLDRMRVSRALQILQRKGFFGGLEMLPQEDGFWEGFAEVGWSIFFATVPGLVISSWAGHEEHDDIQEGGSDKQCVQILSTLW